MGACPGILLVHVELDTTNHRICAKEKRLLFFKLRPDPSVPRSLNFFYKVRWYDRPSGEECPVVRTAIKAVQSYQINLKLADRRRVKTQEQVHVAVLFHEWTLNIIPTSSRTTTFQEMATSFRLMNSLQSKVAQIQGKSIQNINNNSLIMA